MAVVLRGDIHLRQDKTSNIKIRITHHRKVKYISTDLFILPDNFVNGVATGKNASFINGRIRDEIEIYSQRYQRLGRDADKMTPNELMEKLLSGDDSVEIDFLKFADDYLQELKSENRVGSARALQGFIKNIKDFKENVNFSDIDLNFLQAFQKFLKKRGVGNSINNYMRYFRLVFNLGRDKYNDEDRNFIRIPNYPFRKFKIQKSEVKTREHSLTLEQLRLFINYKPVRERERMAQDMFLLMFFLIGINTKDLYFLSNPDIDGRVTYSRAKTKRPYSIKLEPEALAVIEKYRGENKLLNISSKWYNNYLDWQKYINVELKAIGRAISMELQEKDKRLSYPLKISTNWARHSWATIARNDCRIDKDDVALCLGHEDSDNKVTDIYIRYDYSIIDESNRKVLDLLFEKKKEPVVEVKATKKEDKKGKKAGRKQEKQPDDGQYLLFRDISLR